jgi:dTDP-4-dehydrorhamnose reductase
VSGRILLTGASGFLGHHLAAELRARGLDWVGAGRREADLPLHLGDPASLDALDEVRAAHVLHAAALASLAACEDDPQRAFAVNADATRGLAERCGGQILFVSTDLVFGGDRAPYHADDPPAPRSVYGRSKAVGESAVREAGGLVVRVPLLFGPSFDGLRGATDMLRSARGRLPLYTNEFRTPLHVVDAARTLVDLLLEGPGAGVLHLAGPERVSRYELGRRFLAAGGETRASLEAATCTDPRRPRDVSLVPDRPAVRSLDAALVDS